MIAAEQAARNVQGAQALAQTMTGGEREAFARNLERAGRQGRAEVVRRPVHSGALELGFVHNDRPTLPRRVREAERCERCGGRGALFDAHGGYCRGCRAQDDDRDRIDLE